MSTFCGERRVFWSAENRSQIARGEQPQQLGVDAGEPALGIGGGAAQDGAEGADSGERLLGLLGLGEVVAVVGDDELDAEPVGCGGGQGGAPPQPAYLTAERREIGLCPFA